MRLRELVVQRERLVGHFENLLERNTDMVMQTKKRITIGNAGISTGIARIQLDRFCEHPPRHIVIRLRMSVEELAASEIVSVSLDVIGRRRLDRSLVPRKQHNF